MRSTTVRVAATFVVLWAATAHAQQKAGPPSPGSRGQDPLLDRQVYWRELPNGFTYFVQRVRENANAANPTPQGRLLLRLVVKAGSIDEADDQRGLAHMLEHMAFNGSSRFAPGEMVAYFQSIGSKLGPHVNAATTYDHTSYTLDISTRQEGTLGRAFEAMRDIAGGITLDPAEIDRERGVVVEEWRGRLGASSRMQASRMAALFGTSLYANRAPIGDPELLQSFPPERLRDFYRQHYRADRMALIMVGSILDSVADTLIGELFSDLPRSTATRETSSIPAHIQTRFVVQTDTEAGSSSVSVIHKRSVQPATTLSDFRARLMDAVAVRALNARLSEVAAGTTAAFDTPAVNDQPLAGTLRTFSVTVLPRGNRVDDAMGALAEELARVRQHGFSQSEITRAQREVLVSYERVRVDHQALADTLTRYYLGIELAPGPPASLAMAKELLTAIPAAEFNQHAIDLLSSRERVVTAIAPDSTGALPSESVLRTAFDAGFSRPVAPWKTTPFSSPAVSVPPRAAGTVRARREFPEIGVTVLTLSNGVQVWLKPTDFGDDVTLAAVAQGGAALAPAGDFLGASMGGLLTNLAGAGGLSPSERRARLAGRIANVSPVIGIATHGVAGNTRAADVDAALELMALYFTAPNLEALGSAKRIFDGLFANQLRNPEVVLRGAVSRVNSMDHYVLRLPEADDLARLDLDRVTSFYRQRFANAADFTFVVVGAFDVTSITPLLTKYVGSLPSTGKPTSKPADIRVVFPASVVRETVISGREPRSQTTITFFADTGLDEAQVQRAHAAASVLQARLFATLREELGATYSVNVGYADISPLRGYGTISVTYGSAPENASRLADAVLKEVERLRDEGPSAADLQAAKATMSRALTTRLRQNSYWAGAIQASLMSGRDPRTIPQQTQVIDGLTTEIVRDAFRRYFPTDRYTIVSLMPEAKK